MRSFRSLSARLTVQFALVFAAAMLVVSAALSTVISGAASREVQRQLQSSGAVYDRLWQQRAHEQAGAGDQIMLLARGTDGRVRAFANTCRHRGHELLGVGERTTRRTVLCPYHAWTYDLDGALRAAPGFRDHGDFRT